MFYQKHCGAKPYPLRTQDIDFLISIPYRNKKIFDVGNALKHLGFKPGFNPDGSIYYWSTELKVEFLVPEKGKGTDHALSVKALSLKATPLRFLSMLLKNPVTIVEDGVQVSVPNPLNFCLHKLLIAQRRNKKEKKYKDIEQAIYTLPAINPDQFKNEYSLLPTKWRSMIRKSLEQSEELLPLEKNLIDTYSQLL